ncbi:MAG: hypothetical protein KDB00_03385 [Planctomycetales bacterium]|nr:hypothetical protein [Planctomycetales bacterium]
MPVSGLVLSLSEDSQLRDDTCALIENEPRITVGVCEHNRLAIVLDTQSKHEDQQVWDWLASLAGVSMIQVAFVGFESPPDRHGNASLECPVTRPTSLPRPSADDTER